MGRHGLLQLYGLRNHFILDAGSTPEEATRCLHLLRPISPWGSHSSLHITQAFAESQRVFRHLAAGAVTRSGICALHAGHPRVPLWGDGLRPGDQECKSLLLLRGWDRGCSYRLVTCVGSGNCPTSPVVCFVRLLVSLSGSNLSPEQKQEKQICKMLAPNWKDVWEQNAPLPGPNRQIVFPVCFGNSRK